MEATSHHGLKGGKKKRMRAGKGGSTRNKFLFWFYLDLHPFTLRFPTKLGNRRDKAAPGVREAGRGIKGQSEEKVPPEKKENGGKKGEKNSKRRRIYPLPRCLGNATGNKKGQSPRDQPGNFPASIFPPAIGSPPRRPPMICLFLEFSFLLPFPPLPLD